MRQWHCGKDGIGKYPFPVNNNPSRNATLGEDLAEASFYTDSYSDLSVLEAVGSPVAVHPDPRLTRIARKRGWRIERWDTAP